MSAIKSDEEFYSILFKEGLTNDCREYLYNLPHNDLVKLVVEIDYRLWKRCGEEADQDPDIREELYRTEYECIQAELEDGD